MEIASIVFWIVFGCLYIWYRAIRQDPEKVIAQTLACVLLILGLIGFIFLVRAVGTVSIFLAILVGIGVIVIAVCNTYNAQKKSNKILKDLSDRYERVMRIVNSEKYTDKELREFAVAWTRIPNNRWKYKTYGFDGCRDEIVRDYRRQVRYGIVSKRLDESDAAASEQS